MNDPFSGALNSAHAWHIAGWTMIHFLWLGTLVGLVAALCRVALRRVTPNIRYAAALVCLTLLAAMPIGIAMWLIEDASQLRGAHLETRVKAATTGDQVDSDDASDQAIIELSDPSIASATAGADAADEIAVALRPKPESISRPSPKATRISFAQVESFVPYLPWLWIVGTLLTFAMLAAGFVGTKRLRRVSRAIDDPRIADLLARLAASLRISNRVSIAVCERIASPVLVGILRPIILLPPAALTGWSPDEIEMVLLHELAHVRRWDNLVNLVQRVIESLLFFHPAVWLVSSWVRREREACCDAVVVGRTQRPQAYAELLVALAAQMSEPGRPRPRSNDDRGRGRPGSLVMGSAMTAGPLRARIRRILDLEDDPMLISVKSFALMLAGLLVAATLTVLYLPTIGQAEESATEATESTESENVDAKVNSELPKDDGSRKDIADTPVGEDARSLQASPSDRIVVAYEIPGDLVEEVRRQKMYGLWDERGRFVMQSTREKHEQFKSLLQATPKWRDPAAARERSSRPIVMRKEKGEQLLEWRTVGLTFMRETRPEFLPPKGPGGVEVVEVAPGSPAAWQDIQPSDVLTDLDRFRAGSLAELESVIKTLLEGFPNKSKQVQVTVLRWVKDVGIQPIAKELPLRPDDSERDADRREAARAEHLRAQAPAAGARLTQQQLADLEHLRAQAPAAGADRYPAPVKPAAANTNPELPSYVLPTPAEEAARPANPRAAITAHDAAPQLQATQPASTSLLEKRGGRAMMAGGPRRPVATKKSDLRYDGKTFEEWRDLWKNELSNEKRTDAVKALAAFGRAGYGKEATEAILDVAGNYDFLLITSDSEGALKEAVKDELLPDSGNQELVKYWAPDLAARLEQDPERWKWLAVHLLDRQWTKDPSIRAILQSLATSGPSEVRTAALVALVRLGKSDDGQLNIDEKTRELLAGTLSGDDPDAVRIVLPLLLYSPPVGGDGQIPRPKLIFQPQLVPLLFHPDDKLQKVTRGYLQFIDDKDSPPVVAQLVSVLKDDSRKSDHLAAIRALAAMGDKAMAAVTSLKQLFVDRASDKNTLFAIYVSIEKILRDEYNRKGLRFGIGTLTEGLSEQDEKMVLEKMGVDSPEFMQNITRESDTVLPQPDPRLGGGGGFF